MFFTASSTAQGSGKEIVPRAYEFIDSLKKLCKSKKPEVGNSWHVYAISLFNLNLIIKWVLSVGTILISHIWWVVIGANWGCSGGREGERAYNSGRSKKTRGVNAGVGSEKTLHNMASPDDVGRQPGHRGSSGVLYPKCWLHGDCSAEEKQEAWRVFDHHQASERFLAPGLIN